MTENEHIPVIGISGESAESAAVSAMMTQIRSAGAVPLYLGNHACRNAHDDIALLDGVVLTGNTFDVNPELYNEVQHPKTRSSASDSLATQRLHYEEELAKYACEKKIPLLGICGGMQLINVEQGGKLEQHLPDGGRIGHRQRKYAMPMFVPVHPITVEANSHLAELAGEIKHYFMPDAAANPVILENSNHHQSVSVVADGLRIAAYDDRHGQRVVEAIESDPNGKFKDQWILGVQWHPEFGASPLGAKIAGKLVQQSQCYAREHHASRTPQEAYALGIEQSCLSIPQNAPCTSKRITISEKVNEVMHMVAQYCGVVAPDTAQARAK